MLALLLGQLSFGQPTPFRGGLLTNETAMLPTEIADCGKVAGIYMNAQETFMIARTCAGNIGIWRSAGSKFIISVSEKEFGSHKMLSWAFPLFREDFWILPDIEMRPDGLYFNLMRLPPDTGTAVNPGEGGSYRITDKLQSIALPGDKITYTDADKNRRTVQLESISLPFPKNGGGEFFFLKTSLQTTSGSKVLTDGIFSKKGTDWTLVLPFQISPINGLNTTYGLGQIVSVFGINEAIDGSLSYLQRWVDLNGHHFEWMTFSPRTGVLSVTYRYGAPILGISFDFQGTGSDPDTRTRFWRVATGPASSRIDYLAEAPNPSFKPWKWVVPSKGYVSLRGVSDQMGIYLTTGESLITPLDYQGHSLAVWDGKMLKQLVSNGDMLPGGVKVTKVGNGFMNQQAFAPVSGCTARFATYKSDDTVESFWKFEKPCITDVVADSNQVILYGKNLAFGGYTSMIFVDGTPVSGATITADRIVFPSASIASGTRKIQVRMANVDIFSNEASVLVPITIPVPSIASVVTATLEDRPIAPGALFTIRGEYLCSVISTTNLYTPGVTVPIVRPGEVPRLPTLLGGTRVLVNGREIPLNFSSCGLRTKGNTPDCQVNAQMPAGITGSFVRVVIQRFTDINGQVLAATSQEFTVQIALVSPVVFKGGDELPIFQIADRAYALVGKENYVGADETLVGYATGFGLTSPMIEDGVAAGNVLSQVVAESKAWLKFIRAGAQDFREVSVVAFGSPQFAGVVQLHIGALPFISPDLGTEVFLVLRIGDQYTSDMKLYYKN